jgi:4-amino-4-deoxy-L-arabinose transferase-like glycosyltransferase
MASSSLNDGPSALASAFSWRVSLRHDVRVYWPLWLIVAAAIVLRLWDVHRVPGFNGDEAWYGVQVQQLLAGLPIDWRTPTGNVPGMLQIGSLWLLHSGFSPSLLLLRIPALLSSLAALAMAYAVGRRFFGATAGMTALVMMASFPAAIAYARLGWDPSHAPLLVLIAIYAAFAGRLLLSALVFAFALATHPATVFVAPLLVLAHFGFERQRKGGRRWLVSLPMSGCCCWRSCSA